MDTRELLQKVKRLEIKTRGLSKQLFAGDYHSAFKGRGMTFSEVKNYSFGDDVRTIDWNVTARFNEPYVKVFEEEREITAMLILDVSSSNNFGSTTQTKKELISELAAIFAFSASQNNDKVGAIFFSNTIEKYIPPKKGRKHVLMLLREWLEFEPNNTGTSINEALRFFRNVQKQRSIAFLISDFFDPNHYSKSLSIISRKHDLVAIGVHDHAEYNLPDLGIIPVIHAESGEKSWLSTSSRKSSVYFKKIAQEHDLSTRQLMQKSGVDFVSIHTGEEYIKTLHQLFHRRKK